MRSMIKDTLCRSYARLAALSVLGLAAGSNVALADTSNGIGGVATKFNGGLDAMGKTVIGTVGIGGLGLLGSGFLKLKAASDSGGREPYGPGAWRCGAGAAMVGLTTVAAVLKYDITGGATDNGALTVGTLSTNGG